MRERRVDKEIIPDVRPDEWRADSSWNLEMVGRVGSWGMGAIALFWVVLLVLAAV